MDRKRVKLKKPIGLRVLSFFLVVSSVSGAVSAQSEMQMGMLRAMMLNQAGKDREEVTVSVNYQNQERTQAEISG